MRLPAVKKYLRMFDPRNETVQKEMETVFTDYLKKIRGLSATYLLKEG